jgi:hypothetical protein
MNLPRHTLKNIKLADFMPLKSKISELPLRARQILRISFAAARALNYGGIRGGFCLDETFVRLGECPEQYCFDGSAYADANRIRQYIEP